MNALGGDLCLLDGYISLLSYSRVRPFFKVSAFSVLNSFDDISLDLHKVSVWGFTESWLHSSFVMLLNRIKVKKKYLTTCRLCGKI